jgi:fatty-acyl-CoA synthase
LPPFPSVMPALPAASFDALLDRLARQRAMDPVLSWRDPAAAQPDADWALLTGAALGERVDRVARCLSTRHHVQPGQRVAWLGLNHPAQIVLLFALARLGAMLVPLNHRLAPAEWASVLSDCTPSLLVHDAHLASAAQALVQQVNPAPALLPVDRLAAGNPAAAPAPAGSGDPRQTPLLLVYTSGTTGRPKGAVHTQGNLLANMAIAAQVQELDEHDVVATVLPLFHVGGLSIQTLPALSVGAHVLLFARFDAAATLACFEADRPTLTLQVPATLQALSSHPQWDRTGLSSLRAVWAGSSLLPPGPLLAFHARGVPVCNVYGSTETGPFSIALPPAFARSHLGSCGWPAPGVELALCDGQGQPVAPGQVGEICIRAPNVVRHYWPQQAACDDAGFFHTGDLARQATDGSLTVVGRAKDMIISGGENIYPAEVENLLAQHPIVAECAVVGQADARWGEVAVAVVVLRDAARGQTSEQDLIDWCRENMAVYKAPRVVQFVDALPKSGSGKVMWRLLQEQEPAA